MSNELPVSSARSVCLEVLFSLEVQLLQLLDRSAPEEVSEADARLKTVLGGQVDEIHKMFERYSLARAQSVYFVGMLFGVVVVGVIGVALGLPDAVKLVLTPQQIGLILTTLVVGAAGALVSVMQRLTFGELKIEYRAGLRMVFAMGCIRPIIGALFAVVLFALLNAGLLPAIKVPKGDPAGYSSWSEWLPQVYFFTVVAFLAGFSERWAQDVLTAGQAALSPTSKSRGGT